MLKYLLQQLIQEKEPIHITYKREKDETVNSYNLEPIEIKDEYTKESRGYVTYLYAIKLPKTYNSKPQKFILERIISAH